MFALRLWSCSCFVLVAISPFLAFAEEVRAVNLAGLRGSYLLTVDGDRVMVAPLKLYSVTPTPTPLPDPQPDHLTDRSRAIRDSVTKVSGDVDRQKTAQLLAILYAELAKRIESGQIKSTEQITAYAKASVDILLEQRKVSAAWSPFREILSSQWADVARAGGADADYARLLSEVSDGLSAAAPEPQAIDLKQMIELIMLILELVQKLFP